MVHLLNRNYDGKQDKTTPQANVTLRLRRDLFGGRKFVRAMLHAPKAGPADLKLTSDREHTAVTIPKLGFWGIAELE